MAASVAENTGPNASQAWQIYHSCMVLLRSIVDDTGSAVETAEIVAAVVSSAQGLCSYGRECS